MTDRDHVRRIATHALYEGDIRVVPADSIAAIARQIERATIIFERLEKERGLPLLWLAPEITHAYHDLVAVAPQ